MYLKLWVLRVKEYAVSSVRYNRTVCSCFTLRAMGIRAVQGTAAPCRGKRERSDFWCEAVLQKVE